MRFRSTSTLKFEEVPDSELQFEENRYAILSHRWGADEDEVSYADMTSAADVSHKIGYAKIQGFCKLASEEGWRYGWIDTCCINKGDSTQSASPTFKMFHRESSLIAPKTVSFFDRDWTLLGSKSGLLEEISRKTRIPQAVLNHTVKPATCSVAQRMSWAAKRTTKRVEDRAYSLMGLFRINMSMIYGERGNALIRLQQNIIQKSKDESIFAWSMGEPDATSPAYSGLYAPSPSEYVDCSEVVSISGSEGFSEVNGELSITVRLEAHTLDKYFALLHCAERSDLTRRIGILVTKAGRREDFIRVRNSDNISRDSCSASGEEVTKICVRTDPDDPERDDIYFGFWLRTIRPPGYAECSIKILSNSPTPENDYVSQHNFKQGNSGIVRMEFKHTHTRELSDLNWIRFGFKEDGSPRILLIGASSGDRSWLPSRFDMAAGISPCDLEERTGGHKQLFGLFSMDKQQGIRKYSKRGDVARDDLSQDAVRLEIDQTTGATDYIERTFGLKISVQLQILDNAILRRIQGDRSCRGPPCLAKVWVVDITEAPQDKQRRTWRDKIFGR